MALNPFRSEAEAYRFVWLTIGYFGLIVAGAVINKWLGLAVFIVLSAVVLFFYFRRGERQTTVLAPTRARTAEDERRILVIANETVGGETLRETIRQRSEGWRAHVLVVTPALNTPLKHWVSDDDQARDAAQGRLERSLARLNDAGIEARGEIGDGEPLQAIEEAGKGRRQRRPRAFRGPDHTRRRRPGTRERRGSLGPTAKPCPGTVPERGLSLKPVALRVTFLGTAPFGDSP